MDVAVKKRRPLSAETRAKIGQANRGKRHPHSEETKRRIGEAAKGRRCSEETRRKMSEVKIGKPSPMLGRHQSLEARKKIGDANRGRIGNPLSIETRRKMSDARHGKKRSAATCMKLSEGKRGALNPMFGKHHSAETKARIAEVQKGEKSYLWRGGISYLPYSLDWTRTLKRSIRERDHYTCQLCGKPQDDVAHSVHHIDYDKKNCDPSNLITLCRLCHVRTNTNRERWMDYFRGRARQDDPGMRY